MQSKSYHRSALEMNKIAIAFLVSFFCFSFHSNEMTFDFLCSCLSALSFVANSSHTAQTNSIEKWLIFSLSSISAEWHHFRKNKTDDYYDKEKHEM